MVLSGLDHRRFRSHPVKTKCKGPRHDQGKRKGKGKGHDQDQDQGHEQGQKILIVLSG